MRVKVCIFVFILSSCFPVFANTVSVGSAQTVAVNFYKSQTSSVSGDPVSLSLNYTQTESDGTVDFYIFNIDPAPGFIIVSATDNVTPILAYSRETNFNNDIKGAGINGWMMHTASGIHQAVLLQTVPTTAVSSCWASYLSGQSPAVLRSSVVTPMLSTTWGQNPYYNVLCPYDKTNQGVSVTGCVATAMAQIMKFWSFPAHGTGSYTYVDSQGVNGYSWNIGRLSADFGSARYNWAQMPLSLESGDSNTGLLLYHCGVGVGTDYSATSSNAYFDYPGHACALSAFTSYFSYDAQTIKYVVKNAYTTDSWLALIENELNQGRPVFYTGQDTANIGGHAWVCDGYDANGNLHMNWGWGGMDNGYFNVSDLDATPYNFSWDQGAIIGIQPDPAVLALSVADVSPTGSFRLFPNPAKNKITIAGNNDASVSDYIIYNAIGNIISQGSFSTESASIDVSSMRAGVYFLDLQNGKQNSACKFIVER